MYASKTGPFSRLCLAITIASVLLTGCGTPKKSFDADDSADLNAAKVGSGQPVIQSISPAYPGFNLPAAQGTVYGNTPLVIIGANFAARVKVTIGDASCQNIVVKPQSGRPNARIECRAPAHAKQMVSLAVINPNGKAAYSAYTYDELPPHFTSITPDSGSSYGGTRVTVRGSSFSNDITVMIGPQECTSVSVQSSAELSCTTSPSGYTAGPSPIRLTNPDQQTEWTPSVFTYRLPVPAVTSISPNSGTKEGGKTITISGQNFTSEGMTVVLAGEHCTGVTFISSNKLTCKTGPARNLGWASVYVKNGLGDVFLSPDGAQLYHYE